MGTVKSTKYLSYLRVSREVQGRNGYGIAAQRRDIELYLQSSGGVLVEEYVDVISGAKNTRPELDRALERCRDKSMTLLVSKVDRLSRDVEFIARLCKDKKLKIKVASIPNADSFQIHLYALLAMSEREFISTRTKAALRAAKERGVVLGNPRISEMNKTRVREAKKVSNTLGAVVNPLRDKGYTYQEIATTLNEMGMKTRQGCNFHPIQIKRIVDRTACSTR